MKLVIIIGSIILVIILFYGAYYIINPSLEGEEIATQLGMPYPAVIAHRGASAIAPESSALAFIKARDQGADYLEADLQRTKDGKIIVFHDPNLKRVSNALEVFPKRQDEEVGSFTYAQLKQLDIDIITLKDLIDIAKGGEYTPGLALETKNPQKYPGIEEEIVAILSEEGWLNPTNNKEEVSKRNDKKDLAKTIFFSFEVDSLKKFRELAPKVPRLLLITDNMISRRGWKSWLEKAEGLAQGLGTKGFMNWPWYIAAAHDKGLFVLPYTINRLWQLKILAYFQSSGYITDRPEAVLEFLNRLPKLSELEDILEE